MQIASAVVLEHSCDPQEKCSPILGGLLARAEVAYVDRNPRPWSRMVPSCSILMQMRTPDSLIGPEALS